MSVEGTIFTVRDGAGSEHVRTQNLLQRLPAPEAKDTDAQRGRRPDLPAEPDKPCWGFLHGQCLPRPVARRAGKKQRDVAEGCRKRGASEGLLTSAQHETGRSKVPSICPWVRERQILYVKKKSRRGQQSF